MKNFAALLLIMLFTLSTTAQKKGIMNLYVGTFTSEGAEGIYLCEFEENTGKMVMKKIFKGIDNPTFLQLSPKGDFLYAVTRPPSEVEQTGGYIQVYKIGQDGELLFINKQSSNGSGPCHVDISSDGKFAAVATYGGGTVSLYKINSDGSIDAAGSIIKNKGYGPNKDRQNAPHAHSVLFSKDSNKLFSADLGTDRINIFNLDGIKLIPASQPYLKTAPGAGPRHIRFHPDGNALYVINELNSTITVYTKSEKEWQESQTISSLPKDFEGVNYCADIHVSADGRYLYGSNRGHNSIAVFIIDEGSKQLKWKKAVPTHGDWPRNFTLSPDGKFLLAANQKSNDITIFKINSENGLPEFTGNKLKIPAPVCLVFQEETN